MHNGLQESGGCTRLDEALQGPSLWIKPKYDSEWMCFQTTCDIMISSPDTESDEATKGYVRLKYKQKYTQSFQFLFRSIYKLFGLRLSAEQAPTER